MHWYQFLMCLPLDCHAYPRTMYLLSTPSLLVRKCSSTENPYILFRLPSKDHTYPLNTSIAQLTSFITRNAVLATFY